MKVLMNFVCTKYQVVNTQKGNMWKELEALFCIHQPCKGG
jgi:hypothetical protein